MAESKMIITRILKEDFSYSTHGKERSLERLLPVAEIVNLAKNVVRWEWQEKQQTHLFIGYLTTGKGGGFSAVIKDNVIIITVFRRKIKVWEKNHG